MKFLLKTDVDLHKKYGWPVETHPEQLDGEVFMGNESVDAAPLERCLYKTKRYGRVAYSGDVERSIQKNMCPVFISAEDYRESHKNNPDFVLVSVPENSLEQ
jgi:hypothetical protein